MSSEEVMGQRYWCSLMCIKDLQVHHLDSVKRSERYRNTEKDIIIIIIIIMKIIYIAPNPLKGSRRFTKSVTATLQFT